MGYMYILTRHRWSFY